MVQEIVSRQVWLPRATALALFITGTGHRTARAFEGKPTGAPLLDIEYGSAPAS